MIAFDTTFLLDYLDGRDGPREFLEPEGGRPFFAPTLSLYEAYRGAARTGGRDPVDGVASSLDWIEPFPLTDDAAMEAAVIDAELIESGGPINLGDVLVGGVCCQNGASVVTRGNHFDRIDGLDVIGY